MTPTGRKRSLTRSKAFILARSSLMAMKELDQIRKVRISKMNMPVSLIFLAKTASANFPGRVGRSKPVL